MQFVERDRDRERERGRYRRNRIVGERAKAEGEADVGIAKETAVCSCLAKYSCILNKLPPRRRTYQICSLAIIKEVRAG